MNRKSLEDILDELISSLSNNEAAQSYYKKVKEKLIMVNDEIELKIFLDALIGSSKVKDLYNLTFEQCEVWDKMWAEADKLRTKMQAVKF
jgi:hypothetical protein